MSAERSPDGPLRMNRHLNGDCVDVSDLHEQVRLWRETRGLSIESGLWTSLVKPDCGVSENQLERYLHDAGVSGGENSPRGTLTDGRIDVSIRDIQVHVIERVEGLPAEL